MSGKLLGNNAPATLEELPSAGGESYYTQLVKPIYGGPLPTAEATIGTAKKAIFARAVIPVSGVLHDLAVANGETVAGKHVVGVFDTGQATAKKYTLLYQSAEVSASGEKAWQIVASPELTVTAGQQILLAVLNTGTTHKFGTVGAALPAVTELPANFLSLPSENLPKLNGTKTYTEAKFTASLTEAELTVVANPIVIIGRIV